MADTYRPLTADDPVGTEVTWQDNPRCRWTLLGIHDGTAWLKYIGSNRQEVQPLAGLSVRVPDPLPELLEAAKGYQAVMRHRPYQHGDGYLNDKLDAAIAAVEAQQKGASDVAK